MGSGRIAQSASTSEPGVVDTELKHGSSDVNGTAMLNEFYKISIPATSIGRAIAYVTEQDTEVDVNEIVIRPTVQDF